MRLVRLSGSLPSTIAEDSDLGDWAANLAISGDLTGLQSIEVVGPGGSVFAASYIAPLGLVRLASVAQVDYEAFAATGQTPDLAFSLRFSFTDGARQDDPTTFHVAVLDRDDTPPTALRFASGGAVTAGEIGSVIGTLAVEDPDSSGPFFFTFAEEDAWRFEVVNGNTLKLRDGISLGLDDMPRRPLILQVSDGHQSAAFTLDLTVRDPGEEQLVAPILSPGETRAGFTQTDADHVLTLQGAETVAAVNSYGGGVHQVVLEAGGEVWLDGVQRLQFADGWLDFAADGTAAQAASLHQALFGQAATAAELARHVAQLEAGTSWIALAAAMAGSAGQAGLGDAEYLTALHRAIGGPAPDAAALALELGRLASGTSRAQLAVDLALSRETLDRQAEASPDGIWVAHPFGGEEGGTPSSATPPITPASPAADPPPDLGWLL